MGRPAGGDSAETRQRIADAAIEEFATYGYTGARVVRIAAAAGITHAMLPYYFSSKDALYEHVLATLAEPFVVLIATAIGEGLDPAGLTEAIFRGFAQSRAYVRIILWELAAGGGQLTARTLPSVALLEAGLLDGLSAEVGPAQARQGVATLLGAILFTFFEDPHILALLGPARFEAPGLDARARHLGALATWLFAPGRMGGHVDGQGGGL